MHGREDTALDFDILAFKLQDIIAQLDRLELVDRAIIDALVGQVIDDLPDNMFTEKIDYTDEAHTLFCNKFEDLLAQARSTPAAAAAATTTTTTTTTFTEPKPSQAGPPLPPRLKQTSATTSSGSVLPSLPAPVADIPLTEKHADVFGLATSIDDSDCRFLGRCTSAEATVFLTNAVLHRVMSEHGASEIADWNCVLPVTLSPPFDDAVVRCCLYFAVNGNVYLCVVALFRHHG
jgi:hypothetical protein